MAFIAVLGGAGFHSPVLEPKYKCLLKEACKTGLECGTSALNCVEHAITTLENSDLTNAGYGSSLTRHGTVEMDAIVHDGQTGCFGAVGCATSTKNPIIVANRLLKAQLDPTNQERNIGLVQPSFLVGPGVLEWCRRNHIEDCQTKDLIAPERQKEFLEYNKIVTALPEKAMPPQDTVGAICIFGNENSSHFSISAGSSSGGSVMKFPGRIGPAAVIGASCWCETSLNGKQHCGVVVSGEGEFILSKLVAKSLACHVINNAESSQLPLINLAMEAFQRMRLFDGGYQIGLILVLANSDDDGKTAIVDVIWAHSSPSLALGFCQLGSSMPFVKISRVNSNQLKAVEGRTFLLSSSVITTTINN